MAEPVGVALVTGGAKRIGRAVVLDLARRGWAVAIHHRSSDAEAAALVAEIAGAGGRATALRADLCEEEAVETLVPAAAAALGPVTCLVNNASLFERDEALTATKASWDRHMSANLRAPFQLVQAMARGLPDGATGCVVNLLDQRVWNLTPHFTTYTLSKAGLWTLTRTLAMALAPRIRVNGIGPGPTMRNERQTEAHFREQWENVPLARPTSPEDVCAAVRFILDTPSMTGQMIALDGGEHLGWAQPGRGFVAVE
jgi:NAD(P)-dependent dehydrogenase (short-subunit alcohol dehydrogenase family)